MTYTLKRTYRKRVSWTCAACGCKHRSRRDTRAPACGKCGKRFKHCCESKIDK